MSDAPLIKKLNKLLNAIQNQQSGPKNLIYVEKLYVSLDDIKELSVGGEQYMDKSSGPTGAKAFGPKSRAESHGDVSQGLSADDLNGLRQVLSSNGVSDRYLDELERAIQSDPKPTTAEHFGENVGAWIGKMVGNAASGAWKIGVGAASSLLATAIWTYYGFPPHSSS
jgi:hypothetical protein